jgi:hypothetical protein
MYRNCGIINVDGASVISAKYGSLFCLLLLVLKQPDQHIARYTVRLNTLHIQEWPACVKYWDTNGKQYNKLYKHTQGHNITRNVKQRMTELEVIKFVLRVVLSKQHWWGHELHGTVTYRVGNISKLSTIYLTKLALQLTVNVNIFQCSHFLPEVSTFKSGVRRTEGQFLQGALNKMAFLMLQDGRRTVTRSDRQHFSCTTTLRHRGSYCAKTNDAVQLRVPRRMSCIAMRKFYNKYYKIIRPKFVADVILPFL